MKCQIQHTLTLYHGTPYKFEKFQNVTTFFSETPKFAFYYASEKSFDLVLGADITVFECIFRGNLFDIFNENHEKMLEELLPESIYIPSSMFFGLMGGKISKKELMERFKGKMIQKPHDVIVKAKMGEEIEDPEVYKSYLYVIGKDDEYAYTMTPMRLYDVFHHIIGDVGDIRTMSYDDKKYLKQFVSGYAEETEKLYKKYTGERYMSSYFLAFPENKYGIAKAIPDNVIEHIKNQKKKVEQKIMEGMFKRKMYERRFIIKPKVVDINTWQFYENSVVSDIIKSLGFDGHVALERNTRTYAIYEPDKTITACKRI